MDNRKFFVIDGEKSGLVAATRTERERVLRIPISMKAHDIFTASQGEDNLRTVMPIEEVEAFKLFSKTLREKQGVPMMEVIQRFKFAENEVLFVGNVKGWEVWINE